MKLNNSILLSLALVSMSNLLMADENQKSINFETRVVSEGNIKAEFTFKRKVNLKESSDVKTFVENANQFIISSKLIDSKVENLSMKCFDVTDYSSDKKLLATDISLDGKSTEVQVDLSEKSNKSFQVEVACNLYSNKNLILENVTSEFYKDLVVGDDSQSEYKFNQLGLLNSTENQIGALIIKSKKSLITDGQNFSITATDAVFEEESSISTYSDRELNSRAGVAGVSGGELQINVERAFGKLQVNLKGKNAGEQTFQYESRAAQGPAFSEARKIEVNEYENKKCHSYARKGANGTNGRKGVKGLFGGDTGRLIFTASENNKADIKIVSLPGKGGVGGRGEIGGAGAAGEVIKFIVNKRECLDLLVSNKLNSIREPRPRPICHNVKETSSCQGPTGNEGSSGEVGENGDIGKVIESIIK